jgi:hypothetical protein
LSLVAANLILSTKVIQAILPQPNPYYQPGVETRLRALRHVLAEKGRVDVLFIGSSVVRTNFHPFVFDQEILQHTGMDLVSFNGGLSALGLDPVRLYLKEFWLTHATPTLVMQGIRYSELQNVEPAEKCDRFQGDTMEARWLSDKPIAKVELLALNKLPLFYYRGVLRDVLQHFPVPPPRGFRIDIRGYNATSLTLQEALSDGLLEHELGYTSSYSSDTFTRGLVVLEQTADLCKRHNVTYILVNIPEHGDKYLNQSDGMERYHAYLNQLENFAESEGILFIDVTNGCPERYRDDALFSDYHHMSPAGAALFTKELAKELVVYLEN